jgi:5-methylcytosine-specific restriction endonuclease McrA
MHTLVLDISYQPINAVAFTKAIKYLFKGKVEVLKHYDAPIHPDWQAPAVVRLTHWIRPHKRQVKFSRQNVLARDRWKCQYCGERNPTSALTFDHVIPKSRGGKTVWENITTSCIECNTKKANRTPEEAEMVLLKQPARPTWLPIFNIGLQHVTHVPVEWQDYWYTDLLP